MSEPTKNDVLSGRGSSLYRHPGNDYFRELLEKQSVRKTERPFQYPSDIFWMLQSFSQFTLIIFSTQFLTPNKLNIMLSTIHFSKDAYTKGTKKQKMNISESIVDAIYSMEPPGRFLKKCTETGRWTEIPKKEAADKAAQAMAYVIRAGVATAKKKPPQPR